MSETSSSTPRAPVDPSRAPRRPRPRLASALAVALAAASFFAGATGAIPAAAAQTDPDRERALELFRASQASYEAGRFGEAAVYLEEAYRLDSNPILLYNLARARESNGDLVLALEAYRRYLREDPDADDRRAVEARVVALERQIEQRAELEKMVAAEREAREKAAREAEAARLAAAARARSTAAAGPGPVPWIIAGVGGAGLVAGGVLGALAGDRHDAAEAEPTQLGAAELDDEAQGLALGANIAYAAGGALAAGGLLWALLGGDDGGEAPAATLGLGPSGLNVSGHF